MRAHLSFIVVIKIAMLAAFVATVSRVEMGAERNPQAERLGVKFLNETQAAPVSVAGTGFS